MPCPTPARARTHKCRARALARKHADTQPHRLLRQSHLLPSSTLLNFPAPVRVSPFFYHPPPAPPSSLSSLNVSSGTQESSVGQETRKNVRNTTEDFLCCDQLINLKMSVLGSFLLPVWFRQLSNSFKMNFTQNFSGIHLLRTVLFTHYARSETGRSKRITGL